METTNQIHIELPRDRVCDLYCCHETLPLWSPGFIRIEHIDGPQGAVGAVYRQVYVAMGKQIEERITLLELDLPARIRMVADAQGRLLRESTIRFERGPDRCTRLVVENRFSGPLLPHLVQADLSAYTQRFLELFKAFAESQG